MKESNNKQDVFTQLLVIGNGFDIECGLKTKYINFFKERYGINEINNNSCFINESKFKQFLCKNILPSRQKNELYLSNKELNLSKEKLPNIADYYLRGTLNNNRNEKFSNWDLVFLSLYALSDKANLNDNILWCDIETVIFDIVTLMLKDDSIQCGTVNINKTFFKKYNLDINDQAQKFGLILEGCFWKDKNNLNYSKDKIAYDMLKSLNKFEKSFAKYVEKILNEQSKTYFSNAEALIYILVIRNALQDVNSDNYLEKSVSSTKVNLEVLDFNYSLDETDELQILQLLSDYVELVDVNWVNIHGISRSNAKKEKQYFNTKNNSIFGKVDLEIPSPIFGIDNHDILSKDKNGLINLDDPRSIFTKSFRLLDNHINSIRKRKFKNKVDVITFYGHSLSHADYSYFESIFDKYNIFESNTKLEFYYYQGDDQKPSTAKQYEREYMKKVVKLLTSYGATLQEKHGENIVNKLILEQRLSVLPNPQLKN